jgi:hypothetical protein
MSLLLLFNELDLNCQHALGLFSICPLSGSVAKLASVDSNRVLLFGDIVAFAYIAITKHAAQAKAIAATTSNTKS